MSKWIYTAGRLGDHAVTMCLEKDGVLQVRRGPFDWADKIEAQGGYQCEDKQWGDYPIAQQDQPTRLPQVGDGMGWPEATVLVAVLALFAFAAWLGTKK